MIVSNFEERRGVTDSFENPVNIQDCLQRKMLMCDNVVHSFRGSCHLPHCGRLRLPKTATVMGSTAQVLLQCGLLISHQEVETNSPLVSGKWFAKTEECSGRNIVGLPRLDHKKLCHLHLGFWNIPAQDTISEHGHHAVRVTNYKQRWLKLAHSIELIVNT